MTDKEWFAARGIGPQGDQPCGRCGTYCADSDECDLALDGVSSALWRNPVPPGMLASPGDYRPTEAIFYYGPDAVGG